MFKDVVLNELSLEKNKKKGYKKLKNGTELFAFSDTNKEWCHCLYSPLSNEDIQVLNEQLNQKIPTSFQGFLNEFNGLSISFGSLEIFGDHKVKKEFSREEQIYQPRSLILESQYIKGLPDNFFLFAIEERKSLYVITLGDEFILEIDLKKGAVTKQWKSLVFWFAEVIKKFRD